MPYIFEQGEGIDIGSHGDHDYVYASGDPVNDGGDSEVVFESGTGLGSTFGDSLNHVWSVDGGSDTTGYPAYNADNDYIVHIPSEDRTKIQIHDAGDDTNEIHEILTGEGVRGMGMSQKHNLSPFNNSNDIFGVVDMSGQLVWSVSITSEIWFCDAIEDYVARIRQSGPEMVLYDITNGTVLDTSPFPDKSGSAITRFSNDGTELVGVNTAEIVKYSVDTTNDTISEDWRDTNTIGISTPRGAAVVNDEVWVPDQNNGEIVVFAASDGTEKTRVTSGFDPQTMDQGPEGKRVVWGDSDGHIKVANVEDKNVILDKDPSEFGDSPTGTSFFKRNDKFHIGVGTGGAGTHIYEVV